MEDSARDTRRQEALQLLHPVCKSLMMDMTKENVMVLLSALGQVDAAILQEIQQYILFPVQNALHLKKMSDSLLCALCEVVVLVLQKTEMCVTGMFFDTFNPLMYCVTPIGGYSKVSKMSEDTKAMMVKAVNCLLESCTESVLTDFYSYEHLPAIGQVISVLLTLAQSEKSRSLQASALDCILVILQTGTKYGKMNEGHLSNLFACCLPGVTMATCKIATGDSKQGHVVLLRALKVWCRAVTLVMSDHLLKKAQDEMAKPQLIGSANKSQNLEHLEILKIKRDESWVKMTASKLQILVRQICKLVSDSNWKVRLSLADISKQVLMSCSRSLPDCVPNLLETLVGMVDDGYSNVARKAQAALEVFAASQSETSGQRILVQVLEENLYNLTTSLPRRLKMCDEDEKPAIIKLLNGYISILGPQISCVIESAPHLQRLSLALLQALEMDVSNISILEERGSLLHQEPEVFTEMDTHQIWRPRKYFKHFRDEAVLSELMLACRQLGRYGNVHTLVDHMMDLYHESSVYKLAAILVVNEVIVGAGSRLTENKQGKSNDNKNDREVLDSVIRSLLDEYFCPENLRVMDRLTDVAIIRRQPSYSSSPSLASSLIITKPNVSLEAQKNIIRKNQAVLLASLFLEGVAKIASVLKENFQTHLIQTLYPLVENLGHENTYISSSAYTALVEVAVACGHTSLDSLIRHNADYLISSLSVRLRHFDENPRSPRTFCVILRYGMHDLLPQAAHSVTQMLDSVDDNYMDDLVFFMPVLLELTSAIGRWFPSALQNKKEKEVKQPASVPVALDPQVYASHFIERIKNRQIEQELISEVEADQTGCKQEKTTDKSMEEMAADWQKLLKEQQEGKEREEDDSEVIEETKTEPPQHVIVTKEVLRRVKNLLAAQDGRLKVQALDVVCQACKNLADHKKELLPQINELWSGFVLMFSSAEKFIVIKALTTLLVMVEVSGDFLKQRLMKDVIPNLASFMKKQAFISSQSRQAYTFTSQYKLQLCVLSTLGSLATNLELDSNNLDTVAKICIPYLSDLQPVALQKASEESFCDFICLGPDAMWLLLCQNYCPSVPSHKCEQLVPVKFDSSNKISLAKNITELFHKFYSN